MDHSPSVKPKNIKKSREKKIEDYGLSRIFFEVTPNVQSIKEQI